MTNNPPVSPDKMGVDNTPDRIASAVAAAAGGDGVTFSHRLAPVLKDDLHDATVRMFSVLALSLSDEEKTPERAEVLVSRVNQSIHDSLGEWDHDLLFVVLARCLRIPGSTLEGLPGDLVALTAAVILVFLVQTGSVTEDDLRRLLRGP